MDRRRGDYRLHGVEAEIKTVYVAVGRGSRVRRVAGAKVPRKLGCGACGLGDGFDWGSFFQNIGTNTAQAVAGAGVQAITRAINPPPSPVQQVQGVPSAAQIAAAGSSSLAALPDWAWYAGGAGLLLVVVMALRR